MMPRPITPTAPFVLPAFIPTPPYATSSRRDEYARWRRAMKPLFCAPLFAYRRGPPPAAGLNGGAMSILTLAQASTIVDVALKKGRETSCAPLTVAVLDAGGHLVAFKREDRSGILRFDIAYGKAWGALGMGFGSRTLFERAANTPQFFNMLAAASGGRMVSNPGGVLIKDASGDIIGAVGISGDTSDKDEACAVAGIEAAGLKADPGGQKS